MEWEVLFLKNTRIIFSVVFGSLLTLNMLIIFFGLYSYFFNVKDFTLIAGIIAFVGAIIGGVVTYMGVNLTITNEKNKETIKEAKTDYINLHHLLKLVENHTEEINFMHFEDHVPLDEMLRDFRKALAVDGDIYKTSIQLLDIHPYVIRIDNLVGFISDRFYHEGGVEGMSNTKLFFEIMKLYGELEQEINKKIAQLESELGYEWSKLI